MASDYMPRNLMLHGAQSRRARLPGRSDRPITYDVVSLVRDAFISWDDARVLDLERRYWEKRAPRACRCPAISPSSGAHSSGWDAAHLKVLGIFARINYRDGQPPPVTSRHAALPSLCARGRRALSRRLVPLTRLRDEIEA